MNEYIHRYIQAVKTYIQTHKKDITTAAPIVATIVILLGIIVFATVHNLPNIVYQPAKACALLTPEKAGKLLGDHIISTEKNDPVISGDTATSKCAYSDSNPDQNGMAVAAIAVRSGINDKGVAENKADFAANKPKSGVDNVTGVGDEAYFNQRNGQLNILHSHQWIILSYGVGAKPEENSVDKSVELARLILK